MKNIIKKSINQSNEKKGIFDCFLTNFELTCNKSASTIQELRKRENKHTKGGMWEKFCYYYMNNVLNYEHVWLWKDVPIDVKKVLKLNQSRVDNGIDIIAKLNDNSGYTAVQCKYRKNIKQTVTWATLATFVGLCAVCGPWDKHIVMTNCRGVTRKVPRGPKDHTMAYGTFNGISRINWLKMCGEYVEHKLVSGSCNDDNLNKKDNEIVEVVNNNEVETNNVDLIRQARLKKFVSF